MYLDKEPIDFQADVVEASRSRPVVVDFWAAWCAPCRILGPILEKLAGDAGDSWTLVKLNTDLQQEIAAQYKIRGIPAVKMFLNGEVAGEFVGALPETQVRQWLNDHLPGAAKEALAVAEGALKKGDTSTAMVKAREVLDNGDVDPNLEKQATIILAEASFPTDPEESRKLAARFESGDLFFDRAEVVLTRYDLEKGELPEDEDSLARKLYTEGIKLWRAGNRDEAVEKLIESLGEDRRCMDDAARKAIIGIFHILGEEHETTLKYRPRFASTLF
ncbi:MAG: thioredoxin [Candidatus Neomarinimicrobiota bacterium]